MKENRKKKGKQNQRDKQISLFLSLSDLSHKHQPSLSSISQARNFYAVIGCESQLRSYVIANIASNSRAENQAEKEIRQEQIDVHGDAMKRA